MKLKFLGTRGYIEESSAKHKYYSSLLITSGKTKILIDYGLIRKQNLEKIKPNAVLITHAHPDHYSWVKEDIKTTIPVYLTKESYNYGKYKPKNFKIITPGKKFKIGKIEILPYKVIHSIHCPAIGYKIKINKKTLVYNSDLIDIVGKAKILKEVDYYIGDGACIRANLVRRKGNKLFGHARIITQANWCKKFGIENIIITHLGKETIAKEKEFKKKHPEIVLAYDGMELRI